MLDSCDAFCPLASGIFPQLNGMDYVTDGGQFLHCIACEIVRRQRQRVIWRWESWFAAAPRFGAGEAAVWSVAIRPLASWEASRRDQRSQQSMAVMRSHNASVPMAIAAIIVCCCCLHGVRGEDQTLPALAEATACENVAHHIEMLRTGNDNLRLRLEMLDLHYVKQKQHQHDVESKLVRLETKLQELQQLLTTQQREHQQQLKTLLEELSTKMDSQDHSELAHIVDNHALLQELKQINGQGSAILAQLTAAQVVAGTTPAPKSPASSSSSSSQLEVEGLNVCWGIYSKLLGELGQNMTILHNIDAKLKTLGDQYQVETVKHGMTAEVNQALLRYLNRQEDTKLCVSSKNENELVCTVESYPTSCRDYDERHCAKAQCRIRNALYGSAPFLVQCDNVSEGGGWTVIQRRINGSVDFYRGWSEYKNGFGQLEGEFWLGLDKLHALSSTLAPLELLVQLQDHNDTWKYAKYTDFVIGSEAELYELKNIAGYEGNAGDSLGPHKGYKFSTKDRDNDNAPNNNCATDKMGAWWYNNCQWCNLNGLYYKTGLVPQNETGRGINWGLLYGYGYSMKSVRMMIRPRRD